MSDDFNLVLVRHGIAENAAEAERRGVSDADRVLTERGRARTRKAMLGLTVVCGGVTHVVHSPLARARETAALAAEVFDGRIAESGALLPDAPPEALLDWISRHADGVTLVAVGHEPALSRFGMLALGVGSSAGLAFKKAGACLLRFDGPPAFGQGELIWLLPPRVLRRLAAAREMAPQRADPT